MFKRDLKLIDAFISLKNGKAELSFAKVQRGAIIATDTKKMIKFNCGEINGAGLVHKKLLKGFESTLGKDEKVHFEDGYFFASDVKLAIDTGYCVEDENGKNKLGAKYSDYPNMEDVLAMQLPYHFVLESIDDLQFELAQKDCYIDDLHLNAMIAYNDCSIFDIYYKPQTVGEKEQIKTATVKIVAQKADENGVLIEQFIVVIMGRVFESKAKQEF